MITFAVLVLCIPDGSTVVGSDTGEVEKPRTRVVLPVAGVADDSGCIDDDIPEGVLVVLSIVDSEGEGLGMVSVDMTANSETYSGINVRLNNATNLPISTVTSGRAFSVLTPVTVNISEAGISSATARPT